MEEDDALAVAVAVAFDTPALSGGGSASDPDRFAGYETSIAGATEDDRDRDHDASGSVNPAARSLASYSGHAAAFPREADQDGLPAGKSRRVFDREGEYHRRHLTRGISPDRHDPFAHADSTPDPSMRTYADAMRENDPQHQQQQQPAAGTKRPNRWDQSQQNDGDDAAAAMGAKKAKTASQWDATPVRAAGDATPPSVVTPTPKKQRSRWDETPAGVGDTTPGPTPLDAASLATPPPCRIAPGPATPEQYQLLRRERDIEERNTPLADDQLDTILPQQGYKILQPPASYRPVRTPARKLLATPTPLFTPLYAIPEENRGQQFDVPKEFHGLPHMKPEDYHYFGAFLNEEEEEELSPDEHKERRIMKLLLKIKNGTPQQRKVALRQITDKTRELGAGPLFNKILPLLMQPALEDQERHLLVKVIDRVIYKLDDLVRPFVHKILVVVEPLLIDEDYYARAEARQVISNLSKAAGLASMIATMRPDIDSTDEYVRNATARAFSVVASGLGIPDLLPFLKAVCQSKKSWQAPHTGIKIVQQIGILMGCAVLPHLRPLVEITEHGLTDENQKVRTITALSLAALAEAAAPYGIASFDTVLRPLWKGIKSHRGKVLAAFLKSRWFHHPSYGCCLCQFLH
uniref:Splicing factor 3B subunit 1 domain-containing protein n=1 Tax=Oryza brachyantha TaxID=4533 RepID=J3LCV6_ORYBR